MVWELFNILRNNKVNSLRHPIWISNFKNFHIVSQNVWSQLIRWNVYNLNVWIFCRENPAYLRIFPLQELLHWHTLHLIYRKRVNMYLNSFAAFYGRPTSSKLFHHFFPDEKRFICNFLHPILCLFLELIKSKTSLDDSRFCHQEL